MMMMTTTTMMMMMMMTMMMMKPAVSRGVPGWSSLLAACSLRSLDSSLLASFLAARSPRSSLASVGRSQTDGRMDGRTMMMMMTTTMMMMMLLMMMMALFARQGTNH